MSDAAQAFKRDRDAGFAVVPGEVHSASVTDTIGICNTALHLLLAQPCSAKAVRTAPISPNRRTLKQTRQTLPAHATQPRGGVRCGGAWAQLAWHRRSMAVGGHSSHASLCPWECCACLSLVAIVQAAGYSRVLKGTHGVAGVLTGTRVPLQGWDRLDRPGWAVERHEAAG